MWLMGDRGARLLNKSKSLLGHSAGAVEYTISFTGNHPSPVTSVLDMSLNSNAGALGNAEYLFITIAPRSTLPRSGSTW